MTKYKRNKLRQLADLMQKFRETKKKKFHLNYWKKEDTDCGTTCCTIGWGIEKGILPLKQFVLERTQYDEFALEVNGGNGITGIARYFGIFYSQAEKLFMRDSYEFEDLGKPKVVSKRIYEFLKKEGE